MTRKKSHFQDKEPILEPILQKIRFSKIKPYLSKGAKVLDLGCGYDAHLLHHFSDQISEGLGIDISVNKKKETKKIKLKSFGLNKDAKIAKNHFDLVTSLAVTEHLDNPLAMYKTAFKCLKPGGMFVLTTPTPASKPILEFLAFKVGFVSKQEILDHKHYFNVSEIKNLLIRAGFKSANIQASTFSLGLNNFATAKK